jgi:hypothetical protein
VAEGWTRLHNEEFYNLYASPNIIRVIKLRSMIWAGHVVPMGEIDAYNILIRKSEGKRPLGTTKSRWEDNIRVDLRETWW